MENKLISFSSISRELIGEPMNNADALEIIKEQRQCAYNRLQSCKTGNTEYKWLVKNIREVMAFDILIDSFEQYLNHEK